MTFVEGGGEADDLWRVDDGDDRLRDLDRRRRWPWLVGAAALVAVVLVVRAAVPVVQDEIAETRLEVERRRGEQPEAVVGDLIALCVELAEPLRAHVDAPSSLDAVPEAAEVARVLEMHLTALPLVRGQIETRRDEGLGDLVSAREAIDELAAASGSAEELDALRAHARLELQFALGLLDLGEGGVLAVLADGISECRGVPAALEWVLVRS